jgi:homoserine kinase
MMSSTVPIGRAVHVKVPATTANLGPGFDTLGIALSLYDELTATVLDAGVTRVTVRGVGDGTVATDDTNLVVQSMAATFAHFGIAVPIVDLVCDNRIPHGRGMGSSGAAIVGGIMVAKGLLDGIVDIDAQGLLDLATKMEGHPDNVAPALFGGLSIAWMTEAGPQHKKLTVHRGVSLLVAVPRDMTMSTKLARDLQPDTVPHEDAVFNVSRSALLIAALLQSPELLHAATEDKLHQDYRAEAMPETIALIRRLRDEGFAAVVSGAGPSVLVLTDDPLERARAASIVDGSKETRWECLMLAVDFKGATVVVLPDGDGL